MSRKQARADRKHEKQLKNQEKSARLVQIVKEDIRPRVEFDLPSHKTPRSSEDPVSIMQMRMEYNIMQFADREGMWSWGQGRDWCHQNHRSGNACVIRSTMIEMSGLYWHEILSQTTGGRDRRKKHHSHDWNSICDEAQNRWLKHTTVIIAKFARGVRHFELA